MALPLGQVDATHRSVRLRFRYQFRGEDKLNDGACIVLESEQTNAKSKIQVTYLNPKGGVMEDAFTIGRDDTGPFRVSIADGPLGKNDLPTHVLSNVMSSITIAPDSTSRVLAAPNYPAPERGGGNGTKPVTEGSKNP
jgi:hypothetical protein